MDSYFKEWVAYVYVMWSVVYSILVVANGLEGVYIWVMLAQFLIPCVVYLVLFMPDREKKSEKQEAVESGKDIPESIDIPLKSIESYSPINGWHA